jgi:hypothetical protein
VGCTAHSRAGRRGGGAVRTAGTCVDRGDATCPAGARGELDIVTRDGSKDSVRSAYRQQHHEATEREDRYDKVWYSGESDRLCQPPGRHRWALPKNVAGALWDARK